MDALFGVSILASFLAGAAALFAPCCITVLLPAYLASAFREKKNILKMTFIFFSGISVILVPIGLGAASLAVVFQRFHSEMYMIGGLFMVVLGVMAVFGKGLTMIPMAKRSIDMSSLNSKSVFLLGIFSGAATSCCAPVLAGAVTLAALSGTFWKAMAVTFAYVFGMTFPLFLTAYFYDKYNIADSKIIKGRVLKFGVFGKRLYVHSTNLLSAAMFLIIGAILAYLGFTHNAYWSPSLQGKIGRTLNIFSIRAVEYLSFVPNIFWAIIIFSVFFWWLAKMLKSGSKTKQEEKEDKNN